MPLHHISFLDNVQASYDEVKAKKKPTEHNKICQKTQQAKIPLPTNNQNHRDSKNNCATGNKVTSQEIKPRMNNPQTQGRNLNNILTPAKRQLKPDSLRTLSKQKKQKVARTTLQIQEHSGIVKKIQEQVQTRSKNDIRNDVTQIGILLDKIPLTSSNSRLRGDLQRRVQRVGQDLDRQ